ncbi:MAG TPA: nickel-binding protein [Acidimicrobiales bacterium]|nr:nickel-binding protein [Acidimicrobiales bacterium]
MFIDRHDAPGVTPEELANAHRLDVAIQQKHGVLYHTYWFEPENGTVFCLAEGPTKQAIETVHRESHGLLASTILELGESVPLNNFFGSLPQHPVGTAYRASALRAIVFTDVCGSVAQTQQLGDDGHMQLLGEHNSIVRGELLRHEGREVKHTGDGIMAAFTSVVSAVAFAVEVQRRLHERNQVATVPLEVSIGISAGEPVTDDHDDLFGAAVQLAARLCAAASTGDIAVSVAVRELCIGKPIRFEDLGELILKGMPEPTRSYAVSWRDELHQTPDHC